jgi:hypothetical protein
MTEQEAATVARNHLARDRFPDPEFEWVLTRPTRVEDGWYFDHRYDRVSGSGELPAYAGPIGFVVGDDRTVHPLAYSAWRELFGS